MRPLTFGRAFLPAKRQLFHPLNYIAHICVSQTNQFECLALTVDPFVLLLGGKDFHVKFIIF